MEMLPIPLRPRALVTLRCALWAVLQKSLTRRDLFAVPPPCLPSFTHSHAYMLNHYSPGGLNYSCISSNVFIVFHKSNGEFCERSGCRERYICVLMEMFRERSELFCLLIQGIQEVMSLLSLEVAHHSEMPQ